MQISICKYSSRMCRVLMRMRIAETYFVLHMYAQFLQIILWETDLCTLFSEGALEPHCLFASTTCAECLLHVHVVPHPCTVST